MNKTILILSLSCLFAIGCATAYQPKGLTGGYSHFNISPDTFSIRFSGNAYTSRETVKKYLFYRASELTLENGYTYFIITDGEDTTQTSYTLNTNSNTTGNANLYGNTYGTTYGNTYNSSFNAYGNFNSNTNTSSTLNSMSKPVLSIMVKCLNEKPNDFNGLVIDADYYLLSNTVKRP